MTAGASTPQQVVQGTGLDNLRRRVDEHGGWLQVAASGRRDPPHRLAAAGGERLMSRVSRVVPWLLVSITVGILAFATASLVALENSRPEVLDLPEQVSLPLRPRGAAHVRRGRCPDHPKPASAPGGMGIRSVRALDRRGAGARGVYAVASAQRDTGAAVRHRVGTALRAARPHPAALPRRTPAVAAAGGRSSRSRAS